MGNPSATSRFDQQLQRDDAVRARFAPAASDLEIEAFVRQIGLPLPGAFVDLYRLANGNARPRWDEQAQELVGDEEALLPDTTLALGSIDAIVSSKRLWDRLAAEWATGDDGARNECWHLGFWHPAWIPFLEDGAQVWALATAPCFGGPAGQVVWFDFKGHTAWEVKSQSFDGWLATLVAHLEADCTEWDDDIHREHNPDWRFVELPRGDLSPQRFEVRGEPL